MRIAAVNNIKYNFNKNIKHNLNNSIQSFKGDIDETTSEPNAKRVNEPNLVTYIPFMNNKMKLNANIEFFLGALNKIDTNEKRKHLPVEIADIGCCDGALARTLSDFLPIDTKYFGLDLSSEMLDIARINDAKNNKKNTNYIVGNAFDLPFKNDKKDAIIASSIMHELYSYECKEYSEKPYSKDSILHFMQQAYDCLKPGGVLIIKDPATPGSDGWEQIKICNANEDDGTYPPIQDEDELLKADITKLCTLDKLKRFCSDFYPALGNVKWEDNTCIMPRWLITEFVRHRKWLATPENWAYEIKENYGTIRPDEMANFAQKVGFDSVKIENISIPDKNNIYAIREGEFELKDMDDNSLRLEDFPMFLEVVLRKPRNIK